jgi:light-harvesting protein B-800-850 alpha chain
MNEGRLWLYVKPTIGIPLFFLGFMLAALSVHASILYNTTWFAGFFQGGAPVAVAAAPAAAPAMEAAPVEAPAAE